ncbi:MAG: leucine-rich repeat domain-containing protein [Planctomycetota bacterium]
MVRVRWCLVVLLLWVVPPLAVQLMGECSDTREEAAKKYLERRGATVEWVTSLELVSGHSTPLETDKHHYHVELDRAWAGGSLQPLRDLPNLRWMIIRSNARFHGSDLGVLDKLNDLEVLVLETCAVTDETLQHLRNLKQLRMLCLDHASITNRGARHLQVLGNLRNLSLSDTRVGDAGIGNLTEAKKLRRLNLCDTQVGNRGLRVISENFARNLEQLQLAGTAVTDRGMEMVVQLPHLEILDLRNTSISDKGLQSLHRHPNLNFILLNNTNCTPQAISMLRQAWKNRDVKVSFDCPHSPRVPTNSESICEENPFQ